MNFSQTLGASVGQEFIQKLDETERESKKKDAKKLFLCNILTFLELVYRAGQESALQFRNWTNRSIHQIKTVDITSRSQ